MGVGVAVAVCVGIGVGASGDKVADGVTVGENDGGVVVTVELGEGAATGELLAPIVGDALACGGLDTGDDDGLAGDVPLAATLGTELAGTVDGALLDAP